MYVSTYIVSRRIMARASEQLNFIIVQGPFFGSAGLALFMWTADHRVYSRKEENVIRFIDHDF
jgi:hypothetical protein